MEQLGSHRTGFYEIWFLNICRKSVEKIRVLLKSGKNNRYFIHEDICTFMIICYSVLLRMRNVSDRRCGKSQNTLYVQKLFLENLALNEIMWKNKVEPNRPQVTI